MSLQHVQHLPGVARRMTILYLLESIFFKRSQKTENTSKSNENLQQHKNIKTLLKLKYELNIFVFFEKKNRWIQQKKASYSSLSTKKEINMSKNYLFLNVILSPTELDFFIRLGQHVLLFLFIFFFFEWFYSLLIFN